jgi:hypothetical protein
LRVINKKKKRKKNILKSETKKPLFETRDREPSALFFSFPLYSATKWRQWAWPRAGHKYSGRRMGPRHVSRDSKVRATWTNGMVESDWISSLALVHEFLLSVLISVTLPCFDLLPTCQNVPHPAKLKKY